LPERNETIHLPLPPTNRQNAALQTAQGLEAQVQLDTPPGHDEYRVVSVGWKS
jgi:hypothetical protein